MTNKTIATTASVTDFLASIEPENKRQHANTLNRLFQEVTGYKPQMWGANIVGYGSYHYRYDSGREGDFLATGFAPRKNSFSIYIMPGYRDYASILARLGKHKAGKSCLNINKLDDIDLTVLTELVKAGLRDLGQKWPIQAS